MKLTYIANVRLPTEKAHGIQIVKMCEAFSRFGIRVSLIIPKRQQINNDLIHQNIYKYYKVKKNFSVKKLANFDLLPLHQRGVNTGPVAYLIQELSFALNALLQTWSDSLVYTRSTAVALLRGVCRRPIVFEAHDRPIRTMSNITIARNAIFVTCISRSIQRSWDALGAKTVYLPDGVGEEFFLRISKTTARKKLELPLKETVVLYSGNLYPWKGIDTLINAAGRLNKFTFYLIGGSVIDHNIESLKKRITIKNIHVIGHRPYQEIPSWLQAADILVIPNSAQFKKGSDDTSPLKLFEYLSSSTPIIASNVPAIREVCTRKEVTFFTPDDPESLSKKIEWLLNHPAIGRNKAKRGYNKAKAYTWLTRAKKVLSSLR